jgi:hypothetical protein
MASPFRIFRRHTKALLILLVVFLMLVFVLEDSLRMLMGGATGRGNGQAGGSLKPNDNAVHWEGGALTNAELDQLVVRRRILNGFLSQIESEGDMAEIMLARSTGIDPRPSRVPRVARAVVPEQGVENDVVRVRLYRNAALAAGMSVSDEAIRQYLHELGRGRVSTEQMQSLIRGRQTGRGGVSEEYIFEALREELLAHFFENSHAFATAAVMPQQRWQDWLRVNDRVVIEAAAFPAESFLLDVKEPTDEELTAFLDQTDDQGTKYRDREPQPDFSLRPELPSRHPGFKIPRKIEVQYVRADFEKMLTKLKGDVTDEEVQKYYDDNKDPMFIKTATDLIDKPAEKGAAEDAGAKQESGEGKQTDAAAEKSNDADKEATAPGGTTAPAGGEAKGGNPADKGKSAGQTRPNIFRFTALEQDPADAKGEPTAKQGDATTKEDQTKSDKQAETPDDKSKDKEAEKGAATPAETPKKPLEFQPLDDKLRDQIRRMIAEPKVHDRLNQLMTQIQSDLNGEFNKYFRAVIDAQESKQPVPPAPPALADLSALAAKHELEYQKTEPMSILDFRDDKVLGKLVDVERSSMQATVSLMRTLFGKDTDLYKAVVTVDLDNNRYVTMKTSDTPARVPPLSEIREAVVKAWKLKKASEAALKHAEDLTKRIQPATALADFFASDAAVKVIRTDPFAELTGGDVSFIGGQLRQQPYRLSEPDNIVAAGPDFMKKVFSLDEGRAAAVLNHDHSIAYLVRLVEHQNSQDKLHEMFLVEADRWPGLNAMNSQHAQYAALALREAMYQNVGFERDRPLDQIEPADK